MPEVGLAGAALSVGLLASSLVPFFEKGLSFHSEWRKRKRFTVMIDKRTSPEVFSWILRFLSESKEFSGKTKWWAFGAGGPDNYVMGNGAVTTFSYKNASITVERILPSTGAQSSSWTVGEGSELLVFHTSPSNEEQLRALITDAHSAHIQRTESLVKTYTASPDGPTSWRVVAERPYRNMKQVCLTDSQYEVIKQVRQFFRNRSYYNTRGIPFRRGFLLSGPPGTGKSTFVFVVASVTRRHIYYIQISAPGLNDASLLEMVLSIPHGSIILFEDVDIAAATMRRAGMDDDDMELPNGPVRDPGNVTLHGLLNAIDGVVAPEGSVVFMTTNLPDKLDPALKRPGRIDHHECFTYLTGSTAVQMYKHLYPSVPDNNLERIRERFQACIGCQISPAAFQGKCLQLQFNKNLTSAQKFEEIVNFIQPPSDDDDDMESPLDPRIIRWLEHSKAQSYKTQFEAHGMSVEACKALDEKRLRKRIGVSQEGFIYNLLNSKNILD